MAKRVGRSSSVSGQPSTKKTCTTVTKRLCSFSSSWLSEEFEVEHEGEVKKYHGSVLSGNDGDDHAYCKLCKVCFTVTHGGA